MDEIAKKIDNAFDEAMETGEEVSVTITRDPDPRAMISPWDVAKLIKMVDHDDPHWELKVANIIKGYGHGVQASENSAAKWRTETCKTRQDYLLFFQERFAKHGTWHHNWFKTEANGVRLRHFYGQASQAQREKCDTFDQGCTCWKVDKLYE